VFSPPVAAGVQTCVTLPH